LLYINNFDFTVAAGHIQYLAPLFIVHGALLVVPATACSDWPALADWLLKIRCTLKNEDPLIADENHVVRQRSTVLREEPGIPSEPFIQHLAPEDPLCAERSVVRCEF